MEEFLHDLQKLTEIVQNNATKQSNTKATQTEKIPLLPTPHYPQSTPTPHYHNLHQHHTTHNLHQHHTTHNLP